MYKWQEKEKGLKEEEEAVLKLCKRLEEKEEDVLTPCKWLEKKEDVL